MLKVDYVVSKEFGNVLIRWYVNNLVLQDLNNMQFIKPDLEVGDIVRVEIKPSDSGVYVSSNSIEIVESEFIVTQILIDGKQEPIDVSTITPYVQWQDFVPDNNSVNYISIKIGTFFESDNVYSIIIEGNRKSFSIPANILEKGRDYYISIAESDTQEFKEYSTSHFRIRGSRWEESVSNSDGWTLETLFFVETVSANDDYQVIRINDGSKFAEIRLYGDKIRLISGSQIDYNINTIVTSVLTIAGKNNDIMIYLNKELIINGSGVFTQESDMKLLEIGDNSNNDFVIFYKYFFYTTSGYFLPKISEEYSNIQFHKYLEFKENEIISLQGYVGGKYIFGLNPNNENENSTIYAIKSGKVLKTKSIARTFAPINRINKSPDGKISVFAHTKGATVITGYLINPFNQELIFVDDNNNLDTTPPTSNGWELVSNTNFDASSFDADGFHINTL